MKFFYIIYIIIHYSGAESSNPDQMHSTITTHLHNHLTALRNLREGFIEQHGAEPSVSFRYSQQSTSNSTICLRVANNQSNGTDSQDNANVPSTSATENSNNDTSSAEPMVNIKFYTLKQTVWM